MNPMHIHHRLVCECLYPNGAEEKDKQIGRIRTDMLQLMQVSMSTNICLKRSGMGSLYGLRDPVGRLFL